MPAAKRVRRTSFTVQKKGKNASAAAPKRSSIYRSLGNATNGFPKMLTMTHRYQDFTSFSGGAGVTNKQLVCCNGLYDPNITGTGHQPMYFDQVSALYNHYTVTSSRIRATLTFGSTTLGATNVFGIYIEDDASVTPSSIQDFTEQSSAVSKIGNTVYNEPLTVYLSWDAKKAFGGSTLSDPNLQGTVSSNPAEMQNYCIFVGDVAGALQTSVYITYFVEYTAVWQELKAIASS